LLMQCFLAVKKMLAGFSMVDSLDKAGKWLILALLVQLMKLLPSIKMPRSA